MHKDGNNVYWAAYSQHLSIFTANTETGATISELSVPTYVTDGQFAVDQGVIYVATTENTVLKCEASDCANTIERFALKPPSGVDPFTSGNLIVQDADYLYLADNPSGVVDTVRLSRILKNTDASFQVLLPSFNIKVGNLKIHGDSMYWIENVIMGQLLTCPKSGCVGDPTVLMTGLYGATDFAIDDTSIYVLEPPVLDVFSAYGNNDTEINRPGRILKCPIGGCVDPTVVYTTTDEVQLIQLAVDDRFIYFSGNYCSTTLGHNRCAFIAAIPK